MGELIISSRAVLACRSEVPPSASVEIQGLAGSVLEKDVLEPFHVALDLFTHRKAARVLVPVLGDDIRLGLKRHLQATLRNLSSAATGSLWRKLRDSILALYELMHLDIRRVLPLLLSTRTPDATLLF